MDNCVNVLMAHMYKGGGKALLEDFMTKHAFLLKCDDHVRSVPEGAPLMLSRTSAVHPCICPSCALLLCACTDLAYACPSLPCLLVPFFTSPAFRPYILRCLMVLQGDSGEQSEVRTQRDRAWAKLAKYWKPHSHGGQDLTLNRMPDSAKITLVNDMAHAPAKWSAMVTMTKTETRISSARHELSKNPTKHKKARNLCVCVSMCLCVRVLYPCVSCNVRWCSCMHYTNTHKQTLTPAHTLPSQAKKVDPEQTASTPKVHTCAFTSWTTCCFVYHQ